MSADSTGSPPAVQAAEPPAALIKIGSAVIGTLLRSPAHGAVDKAFLLLHVTGRKTGKQYDIVLGRHEVDGTLYVVTSAPWRRNLAGGASVRVTNGGQTRQARAELIEDPDTVAEVYRGEIERLGGPKSGRRLGITINVDRTPSHEELTDAVRREHLSVIRILPA